MTRLIALYKPFEVLCQFSADGSGKRTLAEFIDQPGVYPAGRLDFKSEGLLLLTDNGRLQHRIAHPSRKLIKRYLVQVEGRPGETDLQQLADGIRIREHGREHVARVRSARLISPPALPDRTPPVTPHRAERSSWIDLELGTGINRQIRRSLAALGYPVLRLVRQSVGPWTLEALAPGAWQEVNPSLADARGR